MLAIENATKPKLDIWLELETECNLRCVFCYNFWKDGVSRAPKKLSTQKTLEALQRLFDSIECQSVTVSGGEPLLRGDLEEILAFINGYGVPVYLASNSLLLDRKKIATLMNLGVVTFQIPIHSTAKAIHNMLTGAECFEHTLRAAVVLKDAGANVVAVFVATRLNVADFVGVIELCSLIGIQETIFNRFVPGGLGLVNQGWLGVPTDSDLIPVIAAANLRARELGITIHLGVPIALSPAMAESLDRVTVASCPVGPGQSKWTVDFEGNIRRCNQSSATIGNLLSNGGERLLQKLGQEKTASSEPGAIRTCQFLRTPFVQLGRL